MIVNRNTRLHLVLALSPHLTNTLLQEGILNDDAVELIIKVIGLFKTFGSNIILIIPKIFSGYLLSNLKLKALITPILNDPQSNILFAKSEINSSCIQTTESINDLFNTNLSKVSNPEHINIINILRKERLPIFVDYIQRNITKKKCEHCPNSLCGQYLDVTSFILPSLENLRKYVTLHEKYFFPPSTNSPLVIETIKYYAFIQAFFDNMPLDDIEKIDDIKHVCGFLDDLKGVSISVLKDVAYCSFKALAFPSAQDKRNRHRYSIDWHSNSPNSMNGTSLYRCDIVPIGKTGITDSGKTRILIGKRNMEKYLLCFTEDHNFTDSTISNRVDSIPKQPS
ncbi:MAG: hypothetical protein HQK54_02160 [Oligoflexales bacterium]|nr:hypothetical protein [Oligoflexales bacterium]